MQRGIEYADDEERIENLTINKGQIFATVQGTAPTPYRVKIIFETIPEEGWKKIIDILSSKLINLIKLLGGSLPEDIIDIFKKNNYPLFLDAERDGLNATCSCPDQAIPCKHIAAVILYVARVLDYNPFIILEIRGKTKNDILKALKLSETIENAILKTEVDEIPKNEKTIEFTFNIPSLSIVDLSSEEYTSKDPQKVGFKFKKPGRIIETLENLGLPPNLENTKAFETVLKSIYRSITTEVYKKAMKFEKN